MAAKSLSSAVTCLLLPAVVLFAPAHAQDVPAPAKPQPEARSLEPGLAVDYYYGLTRDVGNVERRARSDEKGDPGEPLPLLDYRTGVDNVLTSDRDDGVGAHIRGFILLDEPGAYQFAAETNDGTRAWIGGVKVVDDPDVHSDQWSEVVTLDVREAGWYPIELMYFERKNTSTLRLVWKKPSGDPDTSLEVVPAEVFGHR